MLRVRDADIEAMTEAGTAVRNSADASPEEDADRSVGIWVCKDWEAYEFDTFLRSQIDAPFAYIQKGGSIKSAKVKGKSPYTLDIDHDLDYVSVMKNGQQLVAMGSAPTGLKLWDIKCRFGSSWKAATLIFGASLFVLLHVTILISISESALRGAIEETPFKLFFRKYKIQKAAAKTAAVGTEAAISPALKADRQREDSEEEGESSSAGSDVDAKGSDSNGSEEDDEPPAAGKGKATACKPAPKDDATKLRQGQGKRKAPELTAAPNVVVLSDSDAQNDEEVRKPERKRRKTLILYQRSYVLIVIFSASYSSLGAFWPVPFSRPFSRRRQRTGPRFIISRAFEGSSSAHPPFTSC